jgi:hypothetical protein
MTENTTPASEPTAAPERREPDRSKSSYRSSPTVSNDSRTTGGSGVQRSHLRDRKSWLKSRTRAGQTWAQRKAASATYCPAKTRAG